MKHWETKSSEVKYENPWISIREDQVIRPNGDDGIYGVLVVKHPAVCIVPIDAEDNTYIVLQERYTTGKESWEITVGGTDGEPVEIAARRELLEETGLEAESIEIIGKFEFLIGLSDHQATVCIARGIKKVTDELDTVDGIITAKKVPLEEVKQMILRGEITDGATIIAILTTLAYLEQSGS